MSARNLNSRGEINMADPVVVPVPAPVPAKPWYLSKTILMNIIMGLAMIIGAFYPPAADFIKTYFADVGVGWSLLNILMRLITKSEIS